jgi:outer membrane lipoprotein-sorting protein
MDIMDLLAQARPGSLDPGPETDRRASDLARAIATPRTGMTAQPGASRRLGVRRSSPPARVIATGISVAALAVTAGVVVGLGVTGTPSARPQPAAPHAGTAVATPGELRNAILTAFNGVGGDVFYIKITEIYPGKKSQWNGVEQDWSYPIQPQAGQQVHIRSVLVPSNPNDKSDTEYIYTEPSGAKAMLPTKTEIIFVQYGNRTWSDTTALVASQTPAASLQELRESIATGDFTAARKTELNGQTVLELTAHYNDAGKESEQIVWVDPATYLPVQTLSDEGGVKIQVDYGFLPPTPANMAELKATIPPGFTRTATIQTGP